MFSFHDVGRTINSEIMAIHENAVTKKNNNLETWREQSISNRQSDSATHLVEKPQMSVNTVESHLLDRLTTESQIPS
jgi:hypothetical protein